MIEVDAKMVEDRSDWSTRAEILAEWMKCEEKNVEGNG